MVNYLGTNQLVKLGKSSPKKELVSKALLLAFYTVGAFTSRGKAFLHLSNTRGQNEARPASRVLSI